jgi:hypothetical protein
MNEIQRNKAHMRKESWGPDYSQLMLAPGGWLIAVTVQLDRRDGNFRWPEGFDLNEPLHIEVTEANGTPLYGGFDIDIHNGYDQGGIVFDEPLPNVNTATPYMLWCETHPCLAVYSLNCWHA